MKNLLRVLRAKLNENLTILLQIILFYYFIIHENGKSF